MSLDNDKEINVKQSEEDIVKNNNKEQVEPEPEPEPEDNNDKYVSTLTDLQINTFLKDNKEEDNNVIEDSKKKRIRAGIQNSTLILINEKDQKNDDILKQLNNNDTQSNNTNNTNNSTGNRSFMQRTKTWMSSMWTNVKNFNYAKYNIFKKTEMEDCLDAHGNHIQIPKNRSDKKLEKKVENNEDFMKYNNLNYNRYFESTNINAFAGYPF